MGLCTGTGWDWDCIDKYAWKADGKLAGLLGQQVIGLIAGVAAKRVISILQVGIKEELDVVIKGLETGHSGIILVDAYFVVNEFFDDINENCRK